MNNGESNSDRKIPQWELNVRAYWEKRLENKNYWLTDEKSGRSLSFTKEDVILFEIELEGLSRELAGKLREQLTKDRINKVTTNLDKFYKDNQ